MDQLNVTNQIEDLMENIKVKFVHGLHTSLIQVNETINQGATNLEAAITNATYSVEQYIKLQTQHIEYVMTNKTDDMRRYMKEELSSLKINIILIVLVLLACVAVIYVVVQIFILCWKNSNPSINCRCPRKYKTSYTCTENQESESSPSLAESVENLVDTLKENLTAVLENTQMKYRKNTNKKAKNTFAKNFIPH